MIKTRTLRIISIGLMIPAAGSLALWLSGLLNIIYMAIINWIVFLAEFVIFIIAIKTSINDRYANVIIPRASCEERYIRAETNIFSNFLIPINPRRDCIYRIQLQLKDFKNYPKFSMIRKCEKDECIHELNKDIELDTEFVHVFEVAINRKERLNFKFSEDVTIKYLLIEELYMV